MEMDLWRRCCRLAILDKARNTRIKEEIGIDIDIRETIEVKTLKWFSHLHRMSDARWPKYLQIYCIVWYRLNNSSLKTEPCGIPIFKARLLDIWFP